MATEGVGRSLNPYLPRRRKGESGKIKNKDKLQLDILYYNNAFIRNRNGKNKGISLGLSRSGGKGKN